MECLCDTFILLAYSTFELYYCIKCVYYLNVRQIWFDLSLPAAVMNYLIITSNTNGGFLHVCYCVKLSNEDFQTSPERWWAMSKSQR